MKENESYSIPGRSQPTNEERQLVPCQSGCCVRHASISVRTRCVIDTPWLPMFRRS